MLDNEYSQQEYSKAIGYIYELMENGTLGIGSRLPTERAIAQTLGIGRNSIREALSILHGMGIIERKQGSGNYICGDAGKSIGQIILMMLALKRVSREDICEFRRGMEKTVCSAVIKKGIAGEHSLALKACLERLESAQLELSKCDDAERAVCLSKLAAADDDFHNVLIKAADNSLMSVVMDAVTQVYKEFIEHVIYNAGENVRDELMDCHRGIYEGIISGDYKMAQAAIDRHYDVASREKLDIL